MKVGISMSACRERGSIVTLCQCMSAYCTVRMINTVSIISWYQGRAYGSMPGASFRFSSLVVSNEEANLVPRPCPLMRKGSGDH